MTYDVHPVADLFPMLPADELDELAADIQERGLLQPVVLDAEGRVLDGRNRLAACELIGLEPTFTTYAGGDPDGYALAVNIARRHLRPSQRYMLIEKARRLTGLPKSVTEVNINRLSEAAVVLDYAPDLAEAVMANALSLASATKIARQRKQEAKEIQEKKERLQACASDLAEHVDDGRLDLDEAIAALNRREEKALDEEAQRRTEEQAAEAEQRRLRDEAQTESAIAIRRFTAITGQLIGAVHSSEWQISEDEWSAFCKAVDAVTEWKGKTDGEA